MKISWTEHQSKQEVLDIVDKNRSLMNTIRQRQKHCLGHTYITYIHTYIYLTTESRQVRYVDEILFADRF